MEYSVVVCQCQLSDVCLVQRLAAGLAADGCLRTGASGLYLSSPATPADWRAFHRGETLGGAVRVSGVGRVAHRCQLLPTAAHLNDDRRRATPPAGQQRATTGSRSSRHPRCSTDAAAQRLTRCDSHLRHVLALFSVSSFSFSSFFTPSSLYCPISVSLFRSPLLYDRTSLQALTAFPPPRNWLPLPFMSPPQLSR